MTEGRDEVFQQEQAEAVCSSSDQSSKFALTLTSCILAGAPGQGARVVADGQGEGGEGPRARGGDGGRGHGRVNERTTQPPSVERYLQYAWFVFTATWHVPALRFARNILFCSSFGFLFGFFDAASVLFAAEVCRHCA